MKETLAILGLAALILLIGAVVIKAIVRIAERGEDDGDE